MLALLILVGGLVLLVAGGAVLVRGASDLAERWGVSPMVVGLTVVGFGTSAPELVVSVIAANAGATSLVFGNVVGSNITNLALILGIAAVLAPMTIEGQLARRELPLLLLATTMLAVLMLDDAIEGEAAMLYRSDALVLLLVFCVFAYIIAIDFLRARRHEDPLLGLVTEFPMLPARHSPFVWIMVLGGIAMLYAGGEATVRGAVGLAEGLGLSATVVGLFVVAIGTSLPELVTTIIAAVRGESDMALGNVIGSNLFNTLFVLPLSAVVAPIVRPEGGIGDIAMAWVLAAVLIPIFFWRQARLGRATGVLLVAAYAGYAVFRVS